MLIANNISKIFDEVIAVEKLSFEMKPTQVIGIVGTNGSGKTTTFRMLLNLIKPDNGSIFWNNQSIEKLNTDVVGYLPEERGLDGEMTIEEHIIYLAQLKNKTKEEISPLIDEWIEEFKIKGSRRDKIKNLSKGNQQKVQLLATLIHDPKLIILDEPFSGLDPVNSDLLKQKILKLKKEKSINIIFSSHNMDHVEEICDQLIMVHKGKVLLNNDLQSIKESFGKNSLLISKNENTESVISSNKAEILDVNEVNSNILKLTLKNEEVGKKLFIEVARNGYIEVFYQDYPTLDEIFRKVVEEYE